MTALVLSGSSFLFYSFSFDFLYFFSLSLSFCFILFLTLSLSLPFSISLCLSFSFLRPLHFSLFFCVPFLLPFFSLFFPVCQNLYSQNESPEPLLRQKKNSTVLPAHLLFLMEGHNRCKGASVAFCSQR